MPSSLRELPGSAWASIFRWTALVTLGSVAISVTVTHIIMSILADGLSAPGLAAAIALPILLGAPVMFYHVMRMQQLHLANERLQVLASTDWLTHCLNRRAFTHQVSGQLETAAEGAFLVVDADHFKSVNDYYGHDRGDEALQLIARTIKSNVRAEDLVGRIGGEEFGVFLAEASPEMAALMADRICRAVATAAFNPEGTSHQLSVSVGGACFKGPIGFTELFRIADQRLYGVKKSGRNRVELVHAAEHRNPHPTPRPMPVDWAKAG